MKHNSVNIRAEWPRLLAIVLFAAGISSTHSLVPKHAPRQELISIAIDLAMFATIPIVYRIWPVPGKKPLPMTIWVLFFTVLAIIMVTARYHFAQPWFERHPRVEEALTRLASASGGFLVPTLGILILIATLFFRAGSPDDKS
jgi:hypothetical protein